MLSLVVCCIRPMRLSVNLFLPHIASRVSLVDYRGNVILDTYVRPTMPVTDYRTASTGIEAHHLVSGVHTHICTFFALTLDPFPSHHASPPLKDSALQFSAVQTLVSGFIRGKILVGHSLWHDLSGVRYMC